MPITGTVPSAATYCAIAFVHGIPSMFIASDGTFKGGTIYPITLQKNLRGWSTLFELQISKLFLWKFRHLLYIFLENFNSDNCEIFENVCSSDIKLS